MIPTFIFLINTIGTEILSCVFSAVVIRFVLYFVIVVFMFLRSSIIYFDD